MHRKGISESITSVILITIILAVSISALSYISSAISISQTSSEVSQMKDLFKTLADQINKLYGIPNATYRVTTTINRGSIGLAEPSNIILNIIPTTSPPFIYTTYNFTYWLPKDLYYEQPQLIYGLSCASPLYKQGNLEIVNSSTCPIPIVKVITNTSSSSWYIKMFPIITISNEIVNNIVIYNIDIVTFKLGTTQKIMGPLTISFTISRSFRTFYNVKGININSYNLVINNPNNIVNIRNSTIIFNFT